MAIEQGQEEGEDRKILSECLEEVDRMIKITKDLLLLAKLDYNTQIFIFEKIDFEEFFQEINEHARMLTSEKNIRLVSDYPKQKLFVNIDKVHLRRLFLNIITNAIKYTPAEGVVKLSAKRLKDALYIDIADTGIGIAEENLPKIFEKFFRIDKGEKVQEGNFGLGLSIALSIARAHQGDIKVNSKINEGTTFTVILPLDS
jgi:signal transduction histidine kinase